MRLKKCEDWGFDLKDKELMYVCTKRNPTLHSIIVYTFLSLPSFISKSYLWVIFTVIPSSGSYFILLLYNVKFYIVQIYHNLYIHSIVDELLSCFQYLMLWILLLWIFLFIYFCLCTDDTFLEVEFLGPNVCLYFINTTKKFFKMIVQIPPNP